MSKQRVGADALKAAGKTVTWVAYASLLLGLVIYLLPTAPSLEPLLKPHPFFKQVIQAIGGLLVGVFAPNIVLSLYTQLKFLEQMAGTFEEHADELKREVTDLVDRQYRFAAHGLVGLTDGLKLREILVDAHPPDVVWCLDTYAKSFSDWAGALERALERGVRVNVLVADPKSPASRMRGAEITRSGHEFMAALTAYKSELDSVQSRFPNLKIVVYDDLPCAPIYIVERDGRVHRARSSYFLRKPTDYNVHFDWRGSGELADQMLDYVKQKWTTAVSRAEISALPPPYVHRAIGYWIYVLEFQRPAQGSVYGRFYIYDDGATLRAEGEAFYVGQVPDRAARRGVWRSRSVEPFDSEGVMNVNYDMLIQNGPLGTPGTQYVGEMKFKGNDLYSSTISGEFFSRVAHSEHPFVGQGTGRARKLPRIDQYRPVDKPVAIYAHEVFKKYLNYDVFSLEEAQDTLQTSPFDG